MEFHANDDLKQGLTILHLELCKLDKCNAPRNRKSIEIGCALLVIYDSERITGIAEMKKVLSRGGTVDFPLGRLVRVRRHFSKH